MASILWILFLGVALEETDAQVSTDTFLEVAGIREAGPPQIFSDVVVFTYEQREFARYVAAAFEHENFQELHVFTARKRDGEPDLFYLSYPIEGLSGEIRYRLIVDGVWIPDPNARKVSTDRRGISLSTVTLPEPPDYRTVSPRFHPDGTVTFSFAFHPRITPTLETVDARQLRVSMFDNPRVTVAGTFNGWDPYMHRLSGPDENDFYSIRIPVPPGPHYYYFIVNGRRILDPLNDQRGTDLQTGALVSRMYVERR